MVVVKIIRLLGIFVLLVIGVFFVVLATIVDIVTGKPNSILNFARIWYRSLLFVLNIHVRLTGEYKHQPALICSNHVSWLDIPVLGSMLPTYFLSKAELRDIPILGWLAQHAGTLFIHRGAGQINEVKILMHDYLSQDHCLTFFPEATTGNGYCLRRFHPRLFAAAIESKSLLLPVSIEYITKKQKNLEIGFGEETLATNLWRILGRLRTDVTIKVLDNIEAQNHERKPLAELAMVQIADSLNLPAERRNLDFRGQLPSEPH